jgi:uncharacterized membrane protein
MTASVFAEKLNLIYGYFEPLVSILDFMSVFIVLWGFLMGFLRFIYVEFFHREGKFVQYQELRRSVGVYIILGLEFMIVSDLLNTIKQRTHDSLIILGSLVVIRTIISYFLGKEMKEAEDEEKDFSLGLRAVKFKSSEPSVASIASEKKSIKK